MKLDPAYEGDFEKRCDVCKHYRPNNKLDFIILKSEDRTRSVYHCNDNEFCKINAKALPIRG